ncbi:K02A2.6-like, partial [Cordylochernes scorpioides]
MIEQTHNQVPQEPTTDATVAASLRTLTLCLDQLLNRGSEEAITYDGDEPAAHFFSQLESQPNFHNLEPARQARKALSSLRGEPRKVAQDLALLNKTYEEVKESLCAVYPRRPSFTLQEFYELKCTSMADIETYYKNKVRIGLAINLPKSAIVQALSNGVPRNYGNLLKMAQPSGPEEWLCLAQQLTYEGDNTSTKAAQQRSPRQSRAPSTTVDKTPPYPCRYCGGQHWHAQCQQRGPYQRPFRTFTPAVHNVEQPQRSTRPAGVYETAATTSSGETNPYSSPVTLVRKRDNTMRLCIDFRRVNELVPSDLHPLQLIETVLDNLSKARVFSTVDISNAYYQIPIAEESQPLLSFVTQQGQYNFKRLPFGFKSAPQIFERVITQLIHKHHLSFIAHYYDDFVIFSDSSEQHLTHLRLFFKFCLEENLQLNLKKCNFYQNEIDFLGYHITAGTYTPNIKNTEIINAIRTPINVKTLQSFLGAVNVYHKFIPEYARLRHPLNQLVRKNAKWLWSPNCQQAFDKLKQHLATQPVLHLFQEGLPCQVYCDASTQGIAGVLKQVHPDGNIYPVQYYSRALRSYERNYTISELECLAIVECVDKFRVYLLGTRFVIYSDHHALQWLKTIKDPTGRLFRWSLRLSAYDYEVKYLKGSRQYEADLLSRNPFCGFLSTGQIKDHQGELRRDTRYILNDKDLMTIIRRGVTKIIVPPSLRGTLLQRAHRDFNHPGISQMTRLIAAQYYWDGMTNDIRTHVRTCSVCQLVKPPKGPIYGELGQLPPAVLPYELVSLDTISGFAKYGNSQTCLHVVVDHATRYAWAFPSRSTSILTYTQVIKKVMQFGSPKRLLTDRAPAFTSPKFRRFLIRHNIGQLLTTSNNPQANGLSERLNATITGKLKLLRLQQPKTAWTKLLPQVLQAYNHTPHSVTGFPPSYLLLEQFNFNNPNEWPNWIKRFERFRKASELKSKKEEEQVNALIYILGEKAEDALISFNLTEIEINNYETVVKKFEEHFIGKRNVIFERAQFNRRYQQDGEAVEEYIRVLHKMAENCNYGSLKEEMIRDRIVVGVKNLQLSEKLQLEPNLTLERAIQAACQTECVKQQQTILRSTTTQAANVDQVYEKKLPPRRFNSTNGKGDASKKSKFQKWSKPEKSGCIRCGASKFHPYKDCPAKEVKCHKCKKVGHFAKVCYNKTVGQVTQGDDYHFVGNIYENGQNSNDWKVYVKVDKIKILFKMDTGADVNIIPQEIYFKNFAHKKLCKPDIQLLGPRQVKLHVIGKFTALIEKDGRSIPGEIFVVPQLMQPLLSGKACESLNLIKRLQSIEKRNSLNPFEEYPKLFTGLGTLQGSYTIKLKDESQPHAIYTPRRIPIPLLNKTKEQLDQMVEKGVIEKVEQPTDWCAPMVIVPKPSSNDLRICVDLTALNKFVKREHYPIPSVEYTLAQMGGAKLFSKLDANSGFWQIPLSEESSSLTTFLTPFGRYRFKRLPFGISSAPEVFQRKMSNLLESQSGVNCHMDDIVIWGATQEEHDERLRCVLRKLQDSGMTLNKEKCIFSVKEIKFLGHLITERGVLPDPNKVQAIREFPSPSSISEVRRFLGMVNFTVSADASSYGLGAVLLQKSEDGYQKAVAYASRTMSETEKRWAQIEKESLAIVWACERFQDYLMGNTFSIETDHKPLIPIFSTKNLDEMTPRIQRLRLRMMRYSYSIHHTPGKDIVVADALSRSPIKISHEKDLENEICSFVQQITSCPPFKDENMKEIWQYQNEERECREIKDYCEKGWPTKNELSAEAKAFWCLRYEMSVIDGLLMRNSRIYIPKSLRSKVLNSLHEGHLGIEKCRGRARSSVWWPRISQEIGELVRNCPNCIEERSNPQQPLIVSDFPSRPWEKVGIDHFYLKGKYYLLIADYYSRFPELALLEDQTTHSTILHCKSIFARHGIPEEVISDNGPQFGLEFKKFAKEYGFHHITSSPRFPQSNGFIESMVKNIKNQLKKGRDPYLSLLGYRTAPLENGYSPAELCMNRKLRTTVPTSPVQLQSRIPDLENLEMREKDQRHKKKTHFDIHHRARELPHLNKGTRVWVKDLRVPGVVLEDAGSPRSYIVNSPKGILRRNRFHLLPNPQGEKIDMEDEEMESPEMSQCFTSTGDNTTCDSEPRTFQRSPEPVKTRSGRV